MERDPKSLVQGVVDRLGRAMGCYSSVRGGRPARDPLSGCVHRRDADCWCCPVFRHHSTGVRGTNPRCESCMKYLPSITSPSDPPSGLARGLSWFAVVAMVLAVGALIDGGWFLEDSVIHETSIQPEKDIEQEWVAQRALLVGADMGSTRAEM